MKGIAASAVGVALLVGLAGCPRPTPITRYDVDPVSIEPSVHAQSLNDSGQVAGTDNTFSGALAALWSVDEGVKHLVTAGDQYSSASSVTNSGVAVGLRQAQDGSPAPDEVVLWQYDTTFQEYDFTGDPAAEVNAINEGFWSVGSLYSSEVDGQVPALFTAGLKDGWQLSTLDQGFGVAYDINEFDEIVGAVNTGPLAASTAVLWTREEVVELPGLATGVSHHAHAINDSQVIVGGSLTDPDDESTALAWRWSNGVTTALPTLGGANSDALDINNGGAIVGWSTDADGVQRAVVWDPNPNGTFTAIDLQDRLEEGDADATGLELTRAIDINNVGQILAEGVQNSEIVYVLLTP